MFPWIGFGTIRQMNGLVGQQFREGVQAQDDNRIATIHYPCQRILVSAGLGNEPRSVTLRQTETYRVAAADTGIQIRDGYLMIMDVQVINTIQFDACVQRVVVMYVSVGIGRSESLCIVGFPGVLQCLFRLCTYTDGVAEDVRLVNPQV